MINYIKLFSDDNAKTRYLLYLIEEMTTKRRNNRDWALESLLNSRISDIENMINLKFKKIFTSETLDTDDVSEIAKYLNEICDLLDTNEYKNYHG